MNLPIKFPAWEDVLADDVTRYRALSSEERVRELEEMLDLYDFLASHSPRREALERQAEADEAAGRAAVVEFAARHGG